MCRLAHLSGVEQPVRGGCAHYWPLNGAKYPDAGGFALLGSCQWGKTTSSWCIGFAESVSVGQIFQYLVRRLH